MNSFLKKSSLFGGINLILLSIVIFIFPEILAYAVAALIFIAGAAMVGFGLRSSKARQNQRGNTQYHETIYYTE